ncbi:MAG: helix-turn-helix domain-containing protein [Thiolinea sp.]
MAGKIKPISTPQANGFITMQLLGQYVKARRTQAGLRIDDAALLCGVAKDTLSKIENGKDTVQVASLLQVLQALGIELKVEPWKDEE